jgi:hypothetical protein
MFLRTLFDLLTPRSGRAPDTRTRRPLTARPRLEALEDRSVPSASGWIADPVGDFLPTYTGAQDPGLDVTAHRVMITPERVIFGGKMAGPIAPTQAVGGLYIIGLDRGQGTARFRNGTPVIGPNVLFDSVVRVNPNGTGLVNNLVAGVVTPLDPADITIDGNEFTASVPLSLLLPAATRPPEEWTYNLWPRNSAVIGNNAAVSDLAPDDGNSPVRVVPPAHAAAALSLLDMGLGDRSASSGFDVAFVPAFTGLDVAIERFRPAPPPIVPPNPVQVAPVFALNYGTEPIAELPALAGLSVADAVQPQPPPISPIFYGLDNVPPPGDVPPLVDVLPT